MAALPSLFYKLQKHHYISKYCIQMIFWYLNKHLTIIDFIWQYLRRFDDIGQNVKILVNILQYHAISDNIIRCITILDENL